MSTAHKSLRITDLAGTATPLQMRTLARERLVKYIRQVTDEPIRFAVLPLIDGSGYEYRAFAGDRAAVYVQNCRRHRKAGGWV